MATTAQRVLLLSSAVQASTIGLCPILGPVFPPPQNLLTSPTFQEAKTDLTSFLDEAFRTGQSTRGPILVDDTYAIQIFSAADNNVFDYFHEGAGLADTVGDLDGDSFYLIASTTKMLTVYLLLIEAGYEVFSDPVTRYLPELKNIGTWDQTTVGAIAGQLGGVVADDELGEQASLDKLFPGVFPELEPQEISPCIANVTHCTKQQFLEALKERRSTNLPNTTPAYSNAGFAMLGFVLEAITGKRFGEVLQERIIGPLNLTQTTDRTPNDLSRGVMIDNATFTGFDIDITEATAMGGVFSSTNDMSAIGRAILTSSLLPANVTRAWLKPTSFTSSLTGGVGRPWEIYRASMNMHDNRVVDMYTKGGNLGVFATQLVLIPEYQVGFMLMIASAQYSQAFSAASLVADVLLPALEDVAREQAESKFAGAYLATNGINSSITLSTTPGKPGLLVESWVSNSTDLLPILGSPGETRIYPTNAEDGNSTKFSWRIATPIDLGVGERGPFSACPSWEIMGRPSYGIYEVDELVFSVDENGHAKSVRPMALKIDLQKQ
ncbi:beta-lactamase/transpeptidase-like protein [Polyplosphaeria fusca]|uniref:Beta-lactamase/transpeptidase-like protein n=1 Tax=Polyplosphaeria fusca TaxID=682080 RepID=A0A9P4RBQ9_9PLEO|nr:beta-lactamase/transpeptidase-like protein [Polyplosphaeria fusca]